MGCLATCLTVLWASTHVQGPMAYERSAEPGSVAGQVIEAVTGLPVAGATVIASADNGRTRTATTTADDTGRFRLADLPDGRYVLWASLPGFSGGYLGQAFPLLQGPPVYAQPSKTDERHFQLRLWRNAVISGKVLDESGQPLRGVAVEALRQTYEAGRPLFGRAPHAYVKTDESGNYLLDRLIPGTYVLVCRPQAPTATLYYPGGLTLAEALPISVTSGDAHRELDLRVPVSPGPPTIVSGSVVGIPPDRLPVEVRLLPAKSLGLGVHDAGMRVRTESNGRFSFTSVPSGNYVLRMVSMPDPPVIPGTARIVQSGNGRTYGGIPAGSDTPIAPAPEGRTFWAELPVSVAQKNMDRVTVVAREGAPITGSLVFRGGAATLADRFPYIGVLVLAADGRDLGSFPTGRIESNGVFQTVALPPGKYVLSFVSLPKGWRFDSVRLNGQVLPNDVVELTGTSPLQLRVSITDEAAGGVSGIVRDKTGRGVGSAVIYLFSADPGTWVDFGPLPRRFRQVRADDEGRFLATLPDGDYFIVPGSGEEPDSWMHSEALNALKARASKVNVGAGQIVQQDLVIRR